MRTNAGSRGGNRFSEVPQANIQRSSFDRSHGVKTTFDGGQLIPIFVDEALPGDTFNLDATIFARMATPLFPFMDNAFVTSFFFAVPYRLIWDNWERFNGAQDNPDDPTDYLTPVMTSPDPGGYANQSLSDYLGIPTQVPGLTHVSLWHRAYNLIWNEWFRDENLQDSVVVDKDDGPDDPADYVVLRRGKRKDYFTSALPWPQKGDAVELPLGSSAPVTTSVDASQSVGVTISTPGSPGFFPAGGGTGGSLTVPIGGPGSAVSFSGTAGGAGPNVLQWNGTGLAADTDDLSGVTATGIADLSAATASTINAIREAFQVQRLLERDARGGTRYTELLRAHFGVVSPDQRLQRPEYLGGGQTPLSVNPVAQTSESGGSPQGTLAAYATAIGSRHGFVKSFVEHCVVIGLCSVRADLTYQQGLPRMFSRRTRFDFYWPVLAHLGEQAVLNKEIYAQGSDDAAADEEVFGYQERFAEYRYAPSRITGKFRSNDAQSLDAWHLAQEFGSLPVLNDSFIQDTPPFERVVAVADEPEFLADVFYRYRCARPMPVYGVPGLVDHF